MCKCTSAPNSTTPGRVEWMPLIGSIFWALMKCFLEFSYTKMHDKWQHRIEFAIIKKIAGYYCMCVCAVEPCRIAFKWLWNFIRLQPCQSGFKQKVVTRKKAVHTKFKPKGSENPCNKILSHHFFFNFGGSFSTKNWTCHCTARALVCWMRAL